MQLAHPVVTTSTLGPAMPLTGSSTTAVSSGPVFLPPTVQPVEAPSYIKQPVGLTRARSAPGNLLFKKEIKLIFY